MKKINQKVREAMNSHGHSLLRYANSILRNREQANDAVQETFIQLSQLDNNDWIEPIAAWLFKVCRSRAIDIQRKEISMQKRHENYQDTIDQKDTSPNQLMESSDSSSHLLKLIESLPSKQNHTIFLSLSV